MRRLLCSTVTAGSFPSPYSGILFLFDCGNGKCSLECDVFRPLIRGFFFYPVTMIRCQIWIFLLSFGGATLSLGKEASLLRNMYISSRSQRHRRGLNLFSSILYRLQFLLINILSHRLLLYHLCPTILLLYGHREYKYAMNLAPHL